MQKQSIKSIIFSALVIFLSACGGGDGETSSEKLVSTSSSIAPVTLSGPLGISDASGVEGLIVTCASVESKTLKNGSLECSNFPIAIYIGEFKIGEVQNTTIDNTFYTQDILGVPRGATAHSEVTKISMILQSLDEDAQPFNGITLTEQSLSLLSAHLSSTTDLTELSFEDIDSIIEDVITARLNQDPSSQLRAVDYITAQSNLTTKIAELPALTYLQRTTEG